MRFFVSFLFFLCFLCSLLLADRGHLIVQKLMNSEFPGLYAVGEPMNISLSIYNVGDGPAFSIHVQDDWPSAFEVTEGSTSGNYEELAAGAHLSHNFTLVPQSEGTLQSFSARISYQPIQDGPTQYAISSPSRNFTVYPHYLYKRYTASHTFQWTVLYGGLAAVVLIPLAAYLNIYNNFEHGLPKAKTA
jgi:hypothetical protein